jgi:hypothetical protein
MVNKAKPEGAILSVAEAKRRYLIYIAMKLVGLAALFGGVFLARGAGTASAMGGVSGGAIALLGVGAATLFVRPRMLGLSKPKRPDA